MQREQLRITCSNPKRVRGKTSLQQEGGTVQLYLDDPLTPTENNHETLSTERVTFLRSRHPPTPVTGRPLGLDS